MLFQNLRQFCDIDMNVQYVQCIDGAFVIWYAYV